MSQQDQWVETKRLAELGLLSAEFIHELRQQVFAIDGLAQIAQRATPRQDLQQLIEQVDRTKQLLERYSDATRRPTLEPQPMALAFEVTKAVDLLRPLAKRKGTSIHLEIDQGDSAIIHCDPVAVQQVVCNLVRNALDAANDKVAVTTSTTRIVVEDDGQGVAQEVRDTLFEPFVTTKPPGMGTGLGLTVARYLVEASGGALTFSNGNDKTRFVADFGTGNCNDPTR